MALHWCPMGVRNAHDAPTATAIKNGSGCRPSVPEMPTAIGAMMNAVAALLMMSERHMVTIMTRVIIDHGGRAPVRPLMDSAISPVQSVD